MKFVLALFSLLIITQQAFALNPCKAVEKRDTNGDQRLDVGEWDQADHVFKKIDRNSDGFITATEYAMRWTEMNRDFIVSGCDLDSDFDVFVARKKTETVNVREPQSFKGLKFQLGLPKGTNQHPVVILSHGSGSPTFVWEKFLNQWGFATITMDHNATHGGKASSWKARAKHRQEDLPLALEYVKTNPALDASDISVIGFSVGAASVFVSGKYDVGRAIAFYPYGGGCDSSKQIPAKLLLLFGSRDGAYNYCGRGRAKGLGITKVYPGAYHGFDDPRASGNCNNHGRYSLCLRHNPEAFKLAQEDLKAFLTE